MPIFFIPAFAEDSITDNEFIEVATRAGVSIANLYGKKLYEFFTIVDEGSTAIVQIQPRQMALLSRYASELLKELPVVILGAPGCVYTGDFESYANNFMVEEWDTFRRRLAKSGKLANDQTQLEDRTNANSYSDTMRDDDASTKAGANRRRSFAESFADAGKPEETTDDAVVPDTDYGAGMI